MKLLHVFIAWLLLCLPVWADCVVLLHGLARTEASFALMEQALESEGYTVVRPGYPSTSATVGDLAEATVPQAVQSCGPERRVHFVTHSMGGILVRHWLASHEVARLGHVVMLGPPNQGTELIDVLKDLPTFSLLNGPASVQMGTGPQSVPRALPRVSYPVGVIAGNQSLNPLFSTMIPGPDDGKVSVKGTIVEGMADHLVLPVTHTFMMNNPRVIAETLTFLATGAFDGSITWVDGLLQSVGCEDGSCLPLAISE